MVQKISNSSVAKEPAPNNSQSEHGQLNSCLIHRPPGRNPLHGTCTILLTLELWDWCMLRDIYLIAQHVPSKTNTLADKESREFLDETDWKLDPRVIQSFLSGCRTDLFATGLTHQLKRYISWRPDPEALNYDALSVNWSGLGDMPSPLSTRYLQS